MIIDWEMSTLWYILRIFLAGVSGFAIGYERKTRAKEAGVRTHAIVALSGALLMVLSKYGFSDKPDTNYDMARIAAQIVSGIGFLGAGMIFFRRDAVHGLTTAAGIWATAGIGMAYGAGMYVIGVASTVMLLGLQIILHLPIRWLKGRTSTILRIFAQIESPDQISLLKQIFKVERFLKFKTKYVDGAMIADIELNTTRVFMADEVYRILLEHPFITSIEKNDEL